jgi:protein-S-isoprenylcysteine O-methyltransferase Ste14
MPDVPLLLLALTLWIYWTRVASLVYRARRTAGRSAGALPRLGVEKLLWAIWVPLVASWLALPWIALSARRPPWALPELARTHPGLLTLRAAAAAIALAALYLTWGCWKRMGKSWRIAILPEERTELITSGLYARVRHPIYALSMALMLSSAVVLPTIPLALMALTHLGLMVAKARREEAHLESTLGQVYTAYCRRTGRFLPRLRPAER